MAHRKKSTQKKKADHLAKRASMAYDPVNLLPLELFGSIIEHLDPADTETLRRVSKSWKVASEYHVSTAWISLKHPELQHREEFKNSESANLMYRRHCRLHFLSDFVAYFAHTASVYVTQMMQKGRANGMMMLPKVGFWHMEASFLVAVPATARHIDSVLSHQGVRGLVEIYHFIGSKVKKCTIDLRKKFRTELVTIHYLRSVGDGGFIVATYSVRVERRSKKAYVHQFHLNRNKGFPCRPNHLKLHFFSSPFLPTKNKRKDAVAHFHINATRSVPDNCR
jgi:hypothetical protein